MSYEHEVNKQGQVEMELADKEVAIGEVTGRRDTSPANVMAGEIAASEDVGFSVIIDGQNFTATLSRSDYQADAPAGYEVIMRPALVTLKDSTGREIVLNEAVKNKLMTELEKKLGETEK